jgi:protein-tyrosine-phosphatase
MDTVMTRVLEVEKECAGAVEKAEQESRQKIEAYKKAIEEKKAREFDLIITAGNEKRTEALNRAKKQAEADFITLRRDSEKLYQDPALTDAIKETILSILLTR